MADEPMRAVVIAAGGAQPTSDRHRYILDMVQGSHLLVAVNGGSDVAMHLGLQPDMIIGDLDSMGAEARGHFLRPGGPEVRSFPSRKDRTDTQLALEHLMSRTPRPDAITVCGAFGDRLDHGLALVLYSASLQVASRKPASVILTDGRQRAFSVTASTVVAGEPGDTVSLIPLTPRVTDVHLEGFCYPLAGQTLRWGTTLGISNVLATGRARVEIRGEGVLLAVHTPRGM